MNAWFWRMFAFETPYSVSGFLMGFQFFTHKTSYREARASQTNLKERSWFTNRYILPVSVGQGSFSDVPFFVCADSNVCFNFETCVEGWSLSSRDCLWCSVTVFFLYKCLSGCVILWFQSDVDSGYHVP